MGIAWPKNRNIFAVPGRLWSLLDMIGAHAYEIWQTAKILYEVERLLIQYGSMQGGNATLPNTAGDALEIRSLRGHLASQSASIFAGTHLPSVFAQSMRIQDMLEARASINDLLLAFKEMRNRFEDGFESSKVHSG
jgi:hypothetical protein